MSVRKDILELQKTMESTIIGQKEILEMILVSVLSNGNLLVEGMPGLAKTRAIKALANNIEGNFSRIQFTPDLKTADITGRIESYKNQDTEETMMRFVKGPIFNNIVLADEINRTPSRTQNALLEAMEERQVTVGGETYPMEKLFMVMATMNPIAEGEGVFPLPEAQKDRFLMNVRVDYPDEAAEMEVVKLVRNENRQKQAKEKKAKPLAQKIIFDARAEIDEVSVPDHVLQYMVDFVFVTRFPERINYELKSYINVGASPRASIALDKASRSFAWLKGDKEVSIEHVRAMATPVLRHRLMVTDRARKHKVLTDELVADIIEKMPVPKAGKQSKSSKAS